MSLSDVMIWVFGAVLLLLLVSLFLVYLVQKRFVRTLSYSLSHWLILVKLRALYLTDLSLGFP
jgi:hypothetical protein